jgi:uncharacterized damage-inducible protein DinB
MPPIQSKPEIIAALRDSNERAQAWFSAIPTQDYFTRQGEVWSAADNVDHMIKAVKPIAKALKLPKITLQAMFGKADRDSRTYEEVCKVYRDEIAKGAKASGRYLPNEEVPDTKRGEANQKQLGQLSDAIERLISACEGWDESALDQYQLPHPLIGKLTIREMLFFTIYHNLRHASQEGD